MGLLSVGVAELSEAGEDLLDGGVAEEDQEPGEEQDDGEAHAFGSGLIRRLGFGQFVGAQRGGLGRQGGPDLGALGPGQGHAGGQLGQLGDSEFVPEPAEGGPGKAPGSIHSHVATPTSCAAPAGGAISIVGEAKANWLAACWATTTGLTWTATVAGCALVTHTGGMGSTAPGPEHSGNTHWPG
jgi:hypothetical protein